MANTGLMQSVPSPNVKFYTQTFLYKSNLLKKKINSNILKFILKYK